ncbi:hypothetical protein BX600DRAFT_510942 [Xylariales sp. PMI_506]|nr:hypothetical protein BX600DRAFT_510942 [Xylariales sp. PMI_506]
MARSRSSSPSVLGSIFDRASSTSTAMSRAPSSTDYYGYVHAEEGRHQLYSDSTSICGSHRPDWGNALDQSRNSSCDHGSGDQPTEEGSLQPGLLGVESSEPRAVLESGETESDEDESDTDKEDEQDDNEWGGQPSRIETAVLSYVQDLDDAAWLIVELQKEYKDQEQRKIGGWQKGIVVNSQGSSTGSNSQEFSGSGPARDTSSSRGKKRRLSESRGKESDGEGDQGDDEGDGDIPQNLIIPESQDGQQSRLPFACPFHKWDPDTFCFNTATDKRYQTCETGQKTIQRLKEHIKRKHVVIQCERCGRIFAEKPKDHNEGLRNLHRHRLETLSCDLRADDSLPCAISIERSIMLDGSNNNKKTKSTDIEKWFEIWKIIFPNHPEPSHPWVDLGRARSVRAINDTGRSFLTVFERALDHEIDTGKIRFEEGQSDTMTRRLKKLVGIHYNVHTYVNGTPCLTDNTSSSNRTQQVGMPATPEGMQIYSASQSRSDHLGKLPSAGGQPYLMIDPNTVPTMGLSAQSQFTGMQTQLPGGLAYQQSNLNFMGAHLPSSTVANGRTVGLVPANYQFNFNSVDWTDMSYPMAPESNYHDS